MKKLRAKLIREVKARPLLYGRKFVNYGSVDERLKLWKEVAEAVGWDVPKCKNTWRNFRESFMSCYRVAKNNPGDSDKGKKKQWKNYDKLNFLIPYLESRDAVNDATMKPNELDIDDTSGRPNPNSVHANASTFLVSPNNTTETLPSTSGSTSKQSELQIQYHNRPNDTPNEDVTKNHFHKLHSCQVSLNRIPEKLFLFSGDTSKIPESQAEPEDTKIFLFPVEKSTETAPAFSENTAEQLELQTFIDNGDPVPVTPKNISINVLETSNQPESVNSSANEKSSNCSPANKIPSNYHPSKEDQNNIGNDRGSYKRSIKRKLSCLTEEKISRILCHEDDPVPMTPKNISTNFPETSKQLELVNYFANESSSNCSSANETPSNCSPANKIPSNYPPANDSQNIISNNCTRDSRGSYKRPVKRKLNNLTEAKILRILCHEENPVKMTPKTFTTNVLETSNQSELVNSSANKRSKDCSSVHETPSNCSPANKIPSNYPTSNASRNNFGNDPSRSSRMSYRKSVKQKLNNLTEAKIYRILCHEDVPGTPKTISSDVLETSNQPESVNSSANERSSNCSSAHERPSNCFPANEIPSNNSQSIDSQNNITNDRSRGSIGLYKRLVKRKLNDISEEKLLRIMSHDDHSDKHFLLSLLPSLKRMTPEQNALARIKLQQAMFDVEFSDLGKNVCGQYLPQSVDQSACTRPSSSSGVFYT